MNAKHSRTLNRVWIAVLITATTVLSVIFNTLPALAENPNYRLVAASADDSQGVPGAYSNAATDGKMGRISAVQNHVALRFTNINIPAGSTITSAYIIFTAKESRASQTHTLTIKAEDVVAPAAYGAAEDFTARAPWTTATTTLISSGSSWVVDTRYASLDLTTIVQELVTSYAPYAAGVMAFEVLSSSGSDGYQNFYMYDASASKCPKLIIKYTPGEPTMKFQNVDVANNGYVDQFSVRRNTTISLECQIAAINGSNVTTRGIEWDVDSGAPYANDLHEHGTWSVATNYTLQMTGLTAHTLYYVRCYGTNTTGTGYSEEFQIYTTPDDAYWVGGTGAWGEAYLHWAISTGGSPNENYYPGVDTNVHFDANSLTAISYTVGLYTNAKPATVNATSAYCNDMDWTGSYTAAAFSRQAASTGTLYIGGNLTLTSTMTWHNNSDHGTFGGTSYLYFTGVGKTITTNGTQMLQDQIEISSGASYTLAGNWTTPDGGQTRGGGGGIEDREIKGTLNLGNYSWYNANAPIVGYSTGTLNAGTANTITCTAWEANASQTLSMGTSQLTVSGSSGAGTFAGGGKTYYNVTVDGYSTASASISGANVFNNLTWSGYYTFNGKLSLGGNQTINGNLNISGYPNPYRYLINTSSLHTQYTITVNGTITTQYTDWQDIAVAGTASWNLSAITGGSGDLGNNAGITFTPPRTVYHVGGAGAYNWTGDKWSNSSGGAASYTYYPIPQDNAVFDANSILVPGAVITVNETHLPNFDATAVTNTPTFTATNMYFYGSVKLGTVTWTATSNYFYGQNLANRFESAVTMTGTLTFDTWNNGQVKLSGNAAVVGTITLLSGIIDCDAYTLTGADFVSNTTTYARTVLLGEGGMTLNSTLAGNKWSVVATNFSLYAETGLITLTSTSTNTGQFVGGTGKVYNDLKIMGSGACSVQFYDDNTFRNIIIDRTQAAKTILGNKTLTLTGTLSIPIFGVTVVTITNTDFTKTSGIGCNSDYLTISGSTAGGGAAYYACTHSTNGGGNAGWTFGSCATAPTISSLAATGIGQTSATIRGSIDNWQSYADGYIFFQYGLTATYDGSWTTLAETYTTTLGTKTQAITGLIAQTQYYFRMGLRYNVGEYAYTLETSFTTLGLPSITTQAATNITDTTATLHAVLTDMGAYSEVWISYEWGTSGAYGNSTDETRYTTAQSVTFALTGLTANHTYYYRANVRYSPSGIVNGNQISFDNITSAATTLPLSINARNIVVDRNVISDSLVTYDQVYLVHYDIVYETAPTDYTVKESYIFQLLDGSGNLLGSQLAYPYVNKGYGQGVVAFYFTAGSTPTWGSAYTIRITGNPTIFTATLPSEDFVLDSANYTTLTDHADTQEFLCQTIISISSSLEQEWQIALVSQQDTGTKLSSNGEAYYRAAIPNIERMAPCLFFLQSEQIDTGKRTWGSSLGDTYKGRLDGTWIKASLQSVADTINIPLTLVYGVILVIVCVFLIKKSQEKFQTAVPGYVGCLLAILCGGFMVMGMVLISIIGLALVIAAGWLLFMRRA